MCLSGSIFKVLQFSTATHLLEFILGLSDLLRGFSHHDRTVRKQHFHDYDH